MTARWLFPLATLALGAFACAQGQDPFPREGDAPRRAKKDPLEGKAPPALVVGAWQNVDTPLALADLHGKVVLLDFWGVW